MQTIPHTRVIVGSQNRGGGFEDDVTRDLEQDVTNEVHGQCGEVLVSG